jgi:hypothetical protein
MWRAGIVSGLLPIALVGCGAGREPEPELVFVSDEEADLVHIVDGRMGRIEGQLKTGETVHFLDAEAGKALAVAIICRLSSRSLAAVGRSVFACVYSAGGGREDGGGRLALVSARASRVLLRSCHNLR